MYYDRMTALRNDDSLESTDLKAEPLFTTGLRNRQRKACFDTIAKAGVVNVTPQLS